MAILKNYPFRLIGLLLAVLGLPACQSPIKLQPAATAPAITAVGYAYLDNQPGPSEGERRLQAMNASKLQAYRQLTEQLYGVELSSPQPDQRWHGISRGTIVGAQVVRQEQDGNLFITELKLDKADFNRLAEMPAPINRTKWWE
ncbi:flagellar assembly lipoprotein FlgP [Pseudaeromonas paramecii]|uniref:Flagellar assembly lipoprotein FlgP n=1 Tax=Pseudaeromonas paramecii TaxID=2138166 RepID=A0ABP8QHK1_9GAMM